MKYLFWPTALLQTATIQNDTRESCSIETFIIACDISSQGFSQDSKVCLNINMYNIKPH